MINFGNLKGWWFKYVILAVLILNYLDGGNAASPFARMLSAEGTVPAEEVAPKEFEEVEVALLRRDYLDALTKYNLIKNPSKYRNSLIIKVYKESGDIDRLLHFAGLIEDLDERHRFIMNIYDSVLSATPAAQPDKPHIETLYACNVMKYIEAVNRKLLSTQNLPADSRESFTNQIESLKQQLITKLLTLQAFTADVSRMVDSSAIYKDAALVNTMMLKNTSILYRKYEIVLNDTELYDQNDCILRVTDSSNDIQVFVKILKAMDPNSFKGNSSRLILNVTETEETKQLVDAVMNRDYNLALTKYKAIKDEQLLRDIIKKLYSELLDFVPITQFGEYVSTHNNGDLTVLTSLHEMMFELQKYSRCELVKLVNTLDQRPDSSQATRTFLEKLKVNVTDEIIESVKIELNRTVKPEYNHKELYVVKHDGDFRFFVQDKESHKTLGAFEYFLNKTGDNETICYYSGTISIDVYGKWYSKYGMYLINWFTFIVVITRYCG